MRAIVNIIDDTGDYRLTYYLLPSRIIEGDSITTYEFGFEFNQFNTDIWNKEINEHD